MWPIYLILIAAVAAVPKTDQEYKEELTRYVMKCTKDHPVEVGELINLDKLIVPKNRETKCLLACAYKLEGSMTKDGMYNIQRSHKLAEAVKGINDKRAKNVLKLGEICAKVNEKPVSDGEKGCDRAGFIFKCIIDNASKLGFKV